MTENKPIIDGVDVSGCKHYKNRTCIADYCLTDMPFSEAKCELNPNCYYKQLALKKKECEYWKHQAELGSDTTDRLAKQLEEKEQECEELKKECNEYFELMAIRTEVLAKNKEIFNKIEQLKTSKEQAEQKLEKITKIANGMHDMWINKTKYTDVYNLAEHLLNCELNRIINEFDEIDEVE